MNTIEIVYPDRRKVCPEQVLTWALDAYDNGEIDTYPESVAHAIDLLNDAGIITTTRRATN